MPKYTEKRILPYKTTDLFDLVMDIEKYPEFLPWVVGARILEQDKDHLLADLIVRFKAFKGKYTSRVTFKRPKTAKNAGTINVSEVEGPFKYLTNLWKFEPCEIEDGKQGTIIDFYIDFEFNSMILEKMIGGMFEKASNKMINSFEERAKELF